MTKNRRHDQKFTTILAFGLALFAAGFAGGCAPKLQTLGPDIAAPMLTADAIVMPDGTALPLRRRLPENGTRKPDAVILALHGFNDYSRAFELPADFWTKAGIAIYAYDQRGFGETEQIGYWPGDDRLIEDANVAVGLLRAEHPDTPIFLLGESMGGAVAMAVLDAAVLPAIDGVVLIAPAVWGRESQGPIAAGALWFFAHTMPWMKLTGEGLRVVPTDNLDVLRAMQNDPLVLKESRVDAVYGLVGLMDRSVASVPQMGRVPTLVLYGANEDVLPSGAVMRALERLPALSEDRIRIGIYRSGYHMLLRDLEAVIVWRDIAAWMTDRTQKLPSGADETARRAMAGEIEDEEDAADALETVAEPAS
ncbi:MAG: alpha/beta hydrolase [Rhodospirillaceae bacterium]|nr:alpha/beta hydrolase [Rhodospirillaceae bacterium]